MWPEWYKNTVSPNSSWLGMRERMMAIFSPERMREQV